MKIESFSQYSAAACKWITTAVEDSVLTLSNDVADAEKAENVCENIGGYLATVNNELLKSELDKIMSKKYTAGAKICFLFKISKFENCQDIECCIV